MKDNRVNTESSRLRSLAFALAAFLLLVCVAFFIFTRLYGRYIDDILYKERQQQMKEVTVQLFKRLDDVTQRWWKDTDVFCGTIEDHAFASLDELYAYLQSLSQLYNVDAEQRHLVAVDESGSYLTHDGWNGTLSEMAFLLDSPERVSFVTSRVGRTDVGIFFLQKLPEPVTVRDGGETVRLTYFGLSCRLAELNPFFSCEAYDNNNSVYVLDPYGGRIFSSGDDTLLGYNAYATLKEMTYLHGTSFEAAKRELDSSGLAYSNAVLNGDEYYYALKKMNNANWTLLFLVSSDYVAQDVVLLVDTTARMVFAFAILLVIACTIAITFILTASQKRTLAIERKNNDKLSAVNRELDQKNTELSAAVRLAESATQEAKAANRAKSEFLTNMSHDIRTPMNAILGITRLMENEQHLSDKMRGYIRKAHASGQHMLALINDVLDMSKIEAGKIRIVSEPVSLAEQIGQIDSIIRPRAAEKAQDFLIRTHDVTHEFLIGDSMRLGQILVNLLSNAVKYTPYGGTIRLDIAELPCVDAEHASLRIVVTDNGYGMTQEFLTHIFDPFTRAESSTTNKVQGTGLGMAITKNIVDLMGGGITVESEPGRGSCFQVTLSLPIDRNTAYHVDASGILLLTDDPQFTDNVRAMTRESGLPVFAADSVDEAVPLLRPAAARPCGHSAQGGQAGAPYLLHRSRSRGAAPRFSDRRRSGRCACKAALPVAAGRCHPAKAQCRRCSKAGAGLHPQRHALSVRGGQQPERRDPDGSDGNVRRVVRHLSRRCAAGRSLRPRPGRRVSGDPDGYADARHEWAGRRPGHPVRQKPAGTDDPHHRHDRKCLCRGCPELPRRRHERPHLQAHRHQSP